MNIESCALDAVSASWSRCIDLHHIDPDAIGATRALARDELDSLRERMAAVLEAARAELDRLHSLVGGIGYATVIASTDGVIVDRRCDPADLARFDEAGVRVGADWRESVEGTNAVGACLIERRPVSVHLHQHFRERHNGLSSAAAPILDAPGRCAAVLMVTSCNSEWSERTRALALALVVESARAIQHRLFRKHHAGSLTTLFDTTSHAVFRGGLSTRTLRRVREYIEAHLHDEIRITKLATLAELSTTHFARAFKESFGMSPHRYVMQARVERAAQLLGSTDHPLADIGFAVGFADQSHFSKTFSRLTGSTPRDFRRAQA
ncbi:MAG TPA: helix-turn-helix domain-containing protein [Steroidobacteraceae bacterium]|nr:helix-turn-helix domain-containing protein [Steroidobacteraceae bacterium]